MVEKYISSKDAEDAVRACCLEASACNLQCIKDIPAADLLPVKRGKWETETLESGKFWANYCSNCDYYLPYGLEWKPSFCPNCGALMVDDDA